MVMFVTFERNITFIESVFFKRDKAGFSESFRQQQKKRIKLTNCSD